MILSNDERFQIYKSNLYNKYQDVTEVTSNALHHRVGGAAQIALSSKGKAGGEDLTALASLVRKKLLPNLKILKSVSLISKEDVDPVIDALKSQAVVLKSQETNLLINFFKRILGVFEGHGFKTKGEWVNQMASNVERIASRAATPADNEIALKNLEKIYDVPLRTMSMFPIYTENTNETLIHFGNRADLLAEMILHSKTTVKNTIAPNDNDIKQLNPMRSVVILQKLQQKPVPQEKINEFIELTKTDFIRNLNQSGIEGILRNRHFIPEFKTLLNASLRNSIDAKLLHETTITKMPWSIKTLFTYLDADSKKIMIDYLLETENSEDLNRLIRMRFSGLSEVDQQIINSRIERMN